MTCVRSAWLVLGSNVVQLDNPAAGYVCSQLDLGPPAVREVTYVMPDADGEIDLTRYLGGRVVQANIVALHHIGTMQIDAIAAQFAPFMHPKNRPQLHYVLERPGNPERVLTVRGASTGYSMPIVGYAQRDIQLQFVAANPIALDPAQKSVVAWSGSTSLSGRNYNLTFPRTYPGPESAPSTAVISTPGDVGVKPALRLYGPVTQPQVTITLQQAGTAFHLYFVAGFRIDAGHYVDVDCNMKTAIRDSDPTQSVLSSIDWNYFYSTSAQWPLIPPAPESAVLSFAGATTTNVTQCVASWYDGYLS